MNGINRLTMRKVSIIFMYAVLGRELDTLIKSVVRTRRVVTFTVTIDSNSFAYSGNNSYLNYTFKKNNFC